jgi:hypothetical protein
LRRSLLATSLLAACAVLFGALAIPLCTGKVFPFGDIASLHVPLRLLYQQALTSGSSFLWTSELGNGIYLHGEGQAGLAHPAHVLLYRLLPLGAALNLEMLASYGLAFSGMWVLLRRLEIGLESSGAGAMVFAFSGFNLLHLNHLNMVAVASHIPWLMWAADLLLHGSTQRIRAAGFAGVALTLGSQLLLGFPQAAWMGLLILAWFVVYRVATGTPLRRVLLLTGALSAGAMIGGLQVLPTLDAVRESYRATPSMTFRLAFSLHPLNLMQLFSPYALAQRIYAPPSEAPFVHEFGLYNGALSTLSAFWIALRWSELRHKRLAAAFLGLAALGLLLSLGWYGGLYPLLAQLPGVSGFRAPTRHILLVHFAFAGMAAVALEDLIALSRQPPPRAPIKIWPLAIPVAIGAALTLAGLGAGYLTPSTVRYLDLRGASAAAGPIVMGVTALLMALGANGRRFALPCLVLLCAADLSVWGLRYVWREAPAPLSAIAPAAGLPPGSQAGDMVRPDVGRAFDLNRYVMWGLRSSAPYIALLPVRSTTLNETQQMRVAGVKWAWTPKGWTRVAGPMPRARLVSDWRIVSSVHDIGAVDVSRTALVDTAPGETAGEPGQAEVLRERPGDLLVETAALHPQLLVLTERFHPGWRVAIDGEPVPVTRVYGDYLGCVVPAGRRRASFVFAPASMRQGLWLTIAGLAVTLLASLMIGRTSDARPA